MNSTFWNSEKLIGLSALFISLTTLMVFMYQTNLIRKQQYMSVYPHLEFTNYNSWSLNYKYVLKNNGVGPAFITDIKVKELNGNEYKDLVAYLGAKKIEKNDSVWFHYSDIHIGQLISANEEIVLFGLSDKAYTDSQGLPANTLEGANKLRDMLNRDSIEVTISYKSIYDEHWSIKAGSLNPVKH